MIDLDDVFVLYRSAGHDVVALRGLSLQVATGERVVVRGPSGSGKSTLLKVVIGEVVPSAGTAVVMGVDIGQLGASAAKELRRERLGIISQGSGRDLIAELTCLDNVALQARLSGRNRADAGDEALAALAAFGVEHLADRWPASLSGGEAQRVGVAAAVAARPGLVVADEPTGELDRDNADAIYDLLAAHAARSGASLFIVTHDAAANRIADRVITLRDGRLSSETTTSGTQLIVDRRGWVRLPEAERGQAGIIDRVVPRVASEGLVLSGQGAPPVAAPITAPVADAQDVGAAWLTADDVSYTVPGARVLEPVSVTVRAGEFLVLAGPSGCGKTTLLAILAGLLPSATGRVERFGEPRLAVYSGVAGFAEAMTVRENLDLAQRVRDTTTSDVLPTVRQLGIDGLIDRPVSMLSGGERQRAAVARALVTDADVVLLDEPTSQLDQASATAVADLLQLRARAGKAIVCTSHDPDILARADRVVSLGDVYSE